MVLNGPYVGSNLFSDKASHKNKHLWEVSHVISELYRTNVLMVFAHNFLSA